MSIPYTLRSIKSDADLIAFASLDFRGQRWEVLQAYYCNLFDLWEHGSDLSAEADERLCAQRWAVEDYATERYPRNEFGRDFFAQSGEAWLAVHDGKALTGALFT
jgi:hypothetical protein